MEQYMHTTVMDSMDCQMTVYWESDLFHIYEYDYRLNWTTQSLVTKYTRLQKR